MLTFNDMVAVALADRRLQSGPYKGFALDADYERGRVHLIEYPIMSNGMRERKIATHMYFLNMDRKRIERLTIANL